MRLTDEMCQAASLAYDRSGREHPGALLAALEAAVGALTPAPAEEIARRFHEAYEDLAPSRGYETRKASAKPWEQVPDDNKALMIDTVQRLIDLGWIRA